MGRPLEGKGTHQRLGQLVSEPFRKWKNALEIFQAHAQSEYHKRNSELADNFLKSNVLGKLGSYWELADNFLKSNVLGKLGSYWELADNFLKSNVLGKLGSYWELADNFLKSNVLGKLGSYWELADNFLKVMSSESWEVIGN
ncbi:52 kDa repressor of the inhibitor of the protein kinase [Biomphalaria glabrata]